MSWSAQTLVKGGSMNSSHEAGDFGGWGLGLHGTGTGARALGSGWAAGMV